MFAPTNKHIFFPPTIVTDIQVGAAVKLAHIFGVARILNPTKFTATDIYSLLKKTPTVNNYPAVVRILASGPHTFYPFPTVIKMFLLVLL